MIFGLLFRFLLYCWTLLLGILGLPLLLYVRIFAVRVPLWFVNLWCFGCLLSLRLCGCRVIYRGFEGVVSGGAIIASQHQSALETLAYFSALGAPAYILKRELYYLPIVGWYLSSSGMVAIDRGRRFRALREVLAQSEPILASGRKLVIFPEGTRVPIGETRTYNKSVYRLYQLGYPVIPVALNSGKFWKKNKLSLGSGDAIFSFLPAIQKGLDEKQFMQTLRSAIENEAKTL